MAKLFLLRSTVLAAAFAVCATAQPRAPIDPKSWLTPEVSTGDQNLPIQPVSGVIVPEERRAAAAGLLINTQIVEISYQEARLFDVEPRNLLGIAGATAFLVRGVSPNGGGMCNASLQGNALSVFCVSLGDFNYELRPIIVSSTKNREASPSVQRLRGNDLTEFQIVVILRDKRDAIAGA